MRRRVPFPFTLSILFIMLLWSDASLAQDLRATITLDSSISRYPEVFTLNAMSRSDIAAIRISVDAPASFAGFLGVEGAQVIPVDDRILEIRPSSDDTSTFAPGKSGVIARFAKSNATWFQRFEVSYLTRNRRSVHEQVIELTIPRAWQHLFRDTCSKDFAILNTGFGAAGTNRAWRVLSGPAGSFISPGSWAQPIPPPIWNPVINAHYIAPADPYNLVKGDYAFQRVFCTRSADSGTISLRLSAGMWQRASVFLNGALIGTALGPNAPGTQILRRVYLLSGVNRVDVVVTNPIPPTFPISPTSFMISDASVWTDRDASMTSDYCPCDTTMGTIRGRKIWDVNCNGTLERGEASNGVQGWTITLTGPGGTRTTTTDANGDFVFTGLPFGSYTVTEAMQSGWVATSPGAAGYGPLTLSAAIPTRGDLTFLNCRPEIGKKNCDSVFTVIESSGECCRTSLEISSAPGRLQKLEYQVLGGSGVINSINAGPCSWTSSPINLNGTTSGVLTFSPTCAPNAIVDAVASATNASGRVCIRWTAYFTRPGTPLIDTCTYTSCVQCPRMELDCNLQIASDPLPIDPTSDEDITHDRRKWTIKNLKVPYSPIASVDMTFLPTRPSGLTGGAVRINGQPPNRLWDIPTSGTPEFSRIRFNCDGAANPPQGPATAGFNDELSFNLSFNPSQSWPANNQYIVRFVVAFCDGDTCVVEKTWQKSGTVPTENTITEVGTVPGLRVARFTVFPPDTTVSLRVRLADSAARIVAATPPDANGGGLARTTVVSSRNEVLYIGARCETCPDEPIARPSGQIAIVFDRGSGGTDSVALIVDFFDRDGRILGTASKTIVSSALSGLPGEGSRLRSRAALDLGVDPNPARAVASIELAVENAGTFTVVVSDMRGTEVLRLLDAARLHSGRHRLEMDTRSLPAGTYVVTARGTDGSAASAQVRVLR